MKKILFGIMGLLFISAIAGWIVIQKDHKQNSPVYLDVRTDQEWQEAHLNNARHFALDRLQKGELPELDKNTEIKVYCRTGRRAEEAVNILKEKGFSKAENVGGLTDLEAKGEKVCTLTTSPTCN